VSTGRARSIAAVFAAGGSVAVVAQETVVSNNSATAATTSTVVGDFYKLLNPTVTGRHTLSHTHNYGARAMSV